jgi:hyperosmotically inducible protein
MPIWSEFFSKGALLIMRYFKRTIIPLAVIVLLAGCNQSDNTTSTSNGSSRGASGDETATVSRTSRKDTNSSRVYSKDTNDAQSYKPDNTGRNVRDRSDATLTPEEQGSSDSDRELTRSIRRAISTNDQFSVLAKNVKIITVNGKATLRGPVENEQEKQGVESAAKSAAPGATVDNQLEVKTTNQ